MITLLHRVHTCIYIYTITAKRQPRRTGPAPKKLLESPQSGHGQLPHGHGSEGDSRGGEAASPVLPANMVVSN